MDTIASGGVENFFYPLLPRVAFGNTDPLRTAGPDFSGNPLPSVGNVGTRSDIATVKEGGPISTITLGRDGSVTGSNDGGGVVPIAAEKRQELVPFNSAPKPLGSVQPGEPQKPLDVKTLGWISGVLIAIGVYLVL